MIKTLTLDGLTSVTIKQSAYDMARFCWVNNRSDSDVYISCTDAQCTENADGVKRIPAGEHGMLDTESYETLYIKGSGMVNIETSPFAVCPFGEGKKGGGTSLSGSASYTISNAVDYPLLGLSLYGKSTQDGTPTPENPVDIVSVGDSGSVEVTADNGEKSTSATITSALPLCGIPVDSGGNYTDSNGQQWVCDELIYNADGTWKIVKRFGKFIVNGTESTYSSFESTLEIGISDTKFEPIKNPKYASHTALVMSNIFKADTANNTWHGVNDNSISINRYTANTAPAVRVYTSKFTNIDDAKTYFTNNPMTFIAELETPQEIELTSSEMARLRQLQTFDGVTNISNDSGADMDVKVCTNKMLSEYVLPITTGLQKQIDELQAAILSLGSNV